MRVRVGYVRHSLTIIQRIAVSGSAPSLRMSDQPVAREMQNAVRDGR